MGRGSFDGEFGLSYSQHSQYVLTYAMWKRTKVFASVVVVYELSCLVGELTVNPDDTS